EGRLEQPALALSTSGRGTEMLRVAGKTRSDGKQPKASRRSRPPASIDRADGFSVDRPPDELMGPFAQQDLAGSCRLLESGRDVYGIPGHQACGTGARGDDLPRVDADAHRHAD